LLEIGFDFGTVFGAILGSSESGRKFQRIRIGLVVIWWLFVKAVVV